MLDSKHTPTPWRPEGSVVDVSGNALWSGSVLPDGNGAYRGPIASILSCDHITGISREEAKANADFIVRACNNHDTLVKLLTKVRDTIAAIDDDSDNASSLLAEINDALRQAGVSQ